MKRSVIDVGVRKSAASKWKYLDRASDKHGSDSATIFF